jgi:hypothetical protein
MGWDYKTAGANLARTDALTSLTSSIFASDRVPVRNAAQFHPENVGTQFLSLRQSSSVNGFSGRSARRSSQVKAAFCGQSRGLRRTVEPFVRSLPGLFSLKLWTARNWYGFKYRG